MDCNDVPRSGSLLTLDKSLAQYYPLIAPNWSVSKAHESTQRQAPPNKGYFAHMDMLSFQKGFFLPNIKVFFNCMLLQNIFIPYWRYAHLLLLV